MLFEYAIALAVLIGAGILYLAFGESESPTPLARRLQTEGDILRREQAGDVDEKRKADGHRQDSGGGTPTKDATTKWLDSE